MAGMMSLLKCAQCGHMGAAYSMKTTLALGLPMVMSWLVIGSLALACGAATALSSDPPRKYQTPLPASSATTTPSMIQVLRDMRNLFRLCLGFPARVSVVGLEPGAPWPGLRGLGNAGWDRPAAGARAPFPPFARGRAAAARPG